MGYVQAGIISGLNAISASTIGEYDYERRLQAYGGLSVECFQKLTYEQAVLIILQAFYDIRSDDISIRHSASNCLVNFVRFLASICKINQSDEMMDGGPYISEKNGLSTCWEQESARVAVQKVLLPNVRKSMGLDSLTVRRVRENSFQCPSLLLSRGKAVYWLILEGRLS